MEINVFMGISLLPGVGNMKCVRGLGHMVGYATAHQTWEPTTLLVTFVTDHWIHAQTYLFREELPPVATSGVGN